MVEVRFGMKSVDLPYSIRIPDVSEAMFDDLVDEDTKAELIDGVMIVHSPASLPHDDVSGFTRTLFRCFVEEKKQGKILGPDSLIQLGIGRKFAPDLYFLDKKQIARRLPRKQFDGVPRLVLEVLSPSNRVYDLEEKRLVYQEAGVKEIWFVDPDQQEVIVDRKEKNGYRSITRSKGILHCSVIPGFWLDVTWLWQEPLPGTLECLRAILEK